MTPKPDGIRINRKQSPDLYHNHSANIVVQNTDKKVKVDYLAELRKNREQR